MKIAATILAAIVLFAIVFAGRNGTKTKPIMEQRLSFVTIGAKDLAKLKEFYTEKFKWVPINKTDKGIAFFKMNGFILTLYPAENIATDAGVANDGVGFKRISLSINYQSVKEVDDAFDSLRSRGVNILKPPQKASWGGYGGYVADIEGNLWEIAYNPYLEMDDNNNVITHH
jgi:catechol 2,3-dioxygenase-like lactoylglutathione lyase family enzyme